MCSFVQQLTLLFPESARFHYSGYVVDAHQVVDVDGEVGFHHRATTNANAVAASLSILPALATGCVQSFGTTSNSVYRGCTKYHTGHNADCNSVATIRFPICFLRDV